MTVNGHSIGENCAGLTVQDRDVIRTVADPLVAAAGFQVMSGNLFRSAVMKMSVVSDEFRARYLSRSRRSQRLRGHGDRLRRSRGLPRPHRRSRPPDRRAQHPGHARHRTDRLPRLGRGGQHAPAGSARQRRHHVAAVHRRRAAVRYLGVAVDPQLRAGSRAARLRTRGAAHRRPAARRRRQGTRRRPPRRRGARATQAELEDAGGYPYPAHQTPWQEIQRSMVVQLDEGMVLEPAVAYQRVVPNHPHPRFNH